MALFLNELETAAGVAVETCQRHVPTFFSIYLGMILPGASKCFFVL